ncbi:MAG: ThiF family adenylyltransferase [Pseudodesulfovibrio sp.]|uniref:HesA/MoeB/ThiF family protein n=1 Tax=Pseudodesulfovibrio sp. TaxID=2035812 RepID=UPI003D0B2D33
MGELKARIRELAEDRPLPWGGTGPVLDTGPIHRLAREHSLPGHAVESAALKLGVAPARYLRNGQALSLTDQARLLDARVALVGLGGLGGALFEQFLRLGIGSIRAADGDSFEETNLNRQSLATMGSVGRDKTRAARIRWGEINPSAEFEDVSEFLSPDNLPDFLDGCAVAVDALGGLSMRGHLQRAAAEASVPLVTGALAGWTGYVAVVLPGQPGPADFMGTQDGAEEQLGCPAPAVNCIASLMAAQTAAVLTGSPSLAGKLLVADLKAMSFDTVTL